jgi:hypothetical protein
MVTLDKPFMDRLKLSNTLSLLLVSLTLALLTVAYTFTLNHVYLTSLTKNVKIVSNLSIASLERGLSYGKGIYELYEAIDIIYPIKNVIHISSDVNVISTNGDIIYSTDIINGVDITDYKKLVSNINKESLNSNGIYSIVSDSERQYFLPIHSGTSLVAYLNVSIPEPLVQIELLHNFSHVVSALLLAIAIAIIIRSIGAYDFIKKMYRSRWGHGKDILKDALYNNLVVFHVPFIIFVLIFSYSQVSYTYLDNVKSLSSVVQSTVNGVISKGARYSDLAGVSSWLNNIDPDHEVVSNIILLNNTVNYSSKITSNNTNNKLYLWGLPDVNNAKAELIFTMTYKGLFNCMLQLLLVTGINLCISLIFIKTVLKIFSPPIK